MKLLTLNCHSWQEDNQLDKIKYLAKTISENDYDVITLQEVSQLINKEIVYDNVKEDNFALLLKNELEGYDFYWDYSHIGYDKYEEGLAILTKHKIISKESFFITENHDKSYWKTRKIIKVTINYQGKDLDFYSCHLGWWQDEEEPFKNQADNLLKTLNVNKLAFVMGDFNNNAFIRDEGYDYLIHNGIIDTFSIAKEHDCGITVKGEIDGWDENKEKLRLDLVLSNKAVNIKSSKVIFNGDNKEVISDHYGVEVNLEI